MDLSWFSDFLTLSRSGNFSRAAKQRHMTQPAFSRRIRLLEEWLGVELFDRSTHPSALTKTGQWFRPVAEELLRRIQRAREEAKAIEKAEIATLRFAATHVLSLTFFPAWLRGLESYLQIGRVQLVSDSLQACEDLMLRARGQLLLCHYESTVKNRLEPAEFQSTRIGTDTLIPVTATNKAGQPRYTFSARMERSLPTLQYSTESGLGRIVRKTLADKTTEDIQFEPVFTSHLAVVLKAMALDGRGIAWLPRSLIHADLDNRRLVEAGGADWHIPVEIRLFRHRSTETSAIEAFWDAVKNHPAP